MKRKSATCDIASTGRRGNTTLISANGMAALGAVDRRLPAAMRARGVRITAQHITKYAADGGVELRRTSDATTFLAALVATRSVPAATKAFARRRRGRCAMVQRYSAAAYMGRPSPARNPRKFLRLLGNFRRIKQMYAGYAPLDALPGEPFEKWAWSGPVFN